ncbi:cytochrome P450 [Backusella circina FSU 941]|nr:cytochrome P450 [Backusella circina FSU 941]
MNFIVESRIKALKFASLLRLITAFTLLYSIYGKLWRKKPKYKEIPSPKGAYPYIGKIPSRQISKWHEEYGDLMKLKMGAQDWVMVGSPSIAHKIFILNGSKSSIRAESAITKHYSLNKRGVLFSNPGKHWNEARAASPKKVDQFTYLIEEQATYMIDTLLESSKKNGPIFPAKNLHLFSLNIICQIAFSKKFKSVDDPEFLDISDLVETMIKLGGPDRNLPAFFPALKIFKFLSKSENQLVDLVRNRRDPTLLELRRHALQSDTPNIVKSLEEDGTPFNIEDILVILSDLIVAGTDTISVTLRWMFAVLCHYPDVQEKAQKELDNFMELNNRIPTFSDRNELPYVISVIKESMRYKPTTPYGAVHSASKDIIVDDYLIPAGTSLISSMERMHENPEVYEDPKTFNPDRYLSNTKTMFASANGNIKERDHYNFGWGRRICPGMYLAEVEIFSSFVRGFLKFNVKPALNENGKEVYPDIVSSVDAGSVLHPEEYKVRFVERSEYKTESQKIDKGRNENNKSDLFNM